jgi:hypothetical protein
MPKVPQSENLPFWMKQNRDYGCIATNLAAILHSFDIRSQRIPNEHYANLESVDEELVLRLLYHSVCFRIIKESEILIKVFRRNGKPTVMVDTADDFPTFNDWWEAVAAHIRQGSYVLISYGVPPLGSHIVTAYEVENDKLSVYNPDPIEVATISFTKSQLDGMWHADPKRLNGDILVVGKV